MKDYTESELQIEHNLPTDTVEMLDFCLNCLYQDNVHLLEDTLTTGGRSLTYEELIGALLQARRTITFLKEAGDSP